jgi:L-alanine-DL-glutamate epimerase-like enolase superfamily enzyme
MRTFRIQEVRVDFEDFAYRAPMKFRATVVDRVTILNVSIKCESNGETLEGFGSTPLGNVWAFPSARLTYAQTLDGMKQLALSVGAITESCKVEDHPIEINRQLEPQYFEAARALNIGESIPSLCTLVVASPFDAALHDAYGKAARLSCYETYGPDHMQRDLGQYLDHQFQGEYLDRYVSSRPAESLALYHLVGALDALTEADLPSRLNDGIPETLEEWVRAEAVNHIKIKLDGNDMTWDLNRVLAVDRVLTSLTSDRNWCYSLDFNERCENVEYVLDCLARVRESSALAFARIQYVEQPTHRDLFAPGTPDMHAAARIKPVVIDESLVDYESLLRARELGYSGVALKACKGQSNALLMAAAAQKFGMFLCVQDLTCPGASLVQSVGLAAHVPPIKAVESNARQYVPAANNGWESQFPGIFRITDGRFHTAELGGAGLGAVPAVVHTN